MLRFFCEQTQQWITDSIQRPIEQWYEDVQNSCQSAPTPINWICSLIIAIVRVILWIVEMVMRLVAVVLCVIGLVIDLIGLILNVVVAILSAIVDFLLSIPIIGDIIRGILNLVGFLVNAITSIPIFGRIIKFGLNSVMEGGSLLGGLFDAALTSDGIKFPKKLGIRVIILKDGNGNPLTTVNNPLLLAAISDAATIFRDQMNVRLNNHGIGIATLNAPPSVLEFTCPEDAGQVAVAWVTDFFTEFGNYIELVSATSSLEGNFGRSIGIGGEIIVLVTRNIGLDIPGGNTTNGCCFGPWFDYAFVEANDPSALAHEIGHACGLPHVNGDTTNLMNKGLTGRLLNELQRAIFRNSRYCVSTF